MARKINAQDFAIARHNLKISKESYEIAMEKLRIAEDECRRMKEFFEAAQKAYDEI
jgi:hypothetical protein